jgi:N-glycosylase/DNA lyase
MSVALALERAVHAVGSRLLAERSEGVSGESTGEAELWWRLLTCVLASQVPYQTAVAAADRITELWPAGPRPASSNEAAEVLEARLRAILQGPLPTSSGARRYRFPQAKARQIARTYCRFRDQRLDLRGMVFAAHPSDRLRDRLVSVVDGLGIKQASMFLRDIGRAADLAIIDRHVLTYVDVVGLASYPTAGPLTRRKYLTLEDHLRRYADFLDLPLGILDRAVWIVVRVAKRERLV